MYLLALVLPGCTFSLLLIVCVGGTKRGGGRGKGEKHKIPPFSLSSLFPTPFDTCYTG